MKINKNIVMSLIVIIVFLFLGLSKVSAALTPSFTLSAVGGNSVQVTISGADPGATAVLFYNSATQSSASVGLGLTNASGYISTTINSGTYDIQSNSPVYVSVDGANSSTTYWPVNSGSSGSLTLSQTILNISGGQSVMITASNVSGTLSITNDSNAAAAIGTVNGNSILVTAYGNYGTTVLTICDSANNCQSLNVSVLSSVNSTFALSSSAANLTIGQSQTITASGLAPFSISQNTNPGAVSATVNGYNIVLTGVSVGSSNITVCQSNGQCGTINSYSNPVNGSTSNTAVSTSITFSPSTVNLPVGQNQTVSLSGSNTGQYYVSNNSNTSSITTNLNGNILTLNAIGIGSSNINICSTSNQCNVLYVNVSSTAVSTISIPLALSSFSISSGNQNNSFLVGGNYLTISFNANQSIVSPSVSVNGTAVAVNGSGNGPYTAVYTMTGSESMPLPIIISFSNSTGATVRQYFWFGNSATIPSTTATPVITTTATAPATPVNCPVGMICMPTATPVPTQGLVNASVSNSSSSYTFNDYLYYDMNNIGQSDPDIVALQTRLIKDGFLSAGSATGYFGPLTKAAVQKYQTYHGLSPLGVVGPATRNLLNQGI